MKLFDKIANIVAAIVSSYSCREEVYNKPLPTFTERAGFKINDELLSKVLVEKYKQKYLPK